MPMQFRFKNPNRHLRAGFTFLDLIVLILLVMLGLAYALVGVDRVHHNYHDMRCGNNLKQIGGAMLLYANDNGNHLPRTCFDPALPPTAYSGASAKHPFATNGPNANDVTAAMYLLLRTQDLTPNVFICPTSAANPLSFKSGTDANSFSNFFSKRYLSYSLTNCYPSPAATQNGFKWTSTLTADFAIAADMNPGTPELFALKPSNIQSALQNGNSYNHQRAGQNVLFGDWHTEWQATPFCGYNNDNIYGPGTLVNASVTPPLIDPAISGNTFYASPAHTKDSVLLPTDADMQGYADPKTSEKLTWQIQAFNSELTPILTLMGMGFLGVRVWLYKRKRTN